ncbi:hypothetical protein [Tsukamurella pulmonis]|uniref:hypothetical protein n=1 Tax=Tsukamurella pulmonis TaxID=47312 RepID=UPI001EDE644B|nr:hypothetical protein [Tsukamurella pulmonis]
MTVVHGRGLGNPVKFHGDPYGSDGEQGFTQISNRLCRSDTITPGGKAVALYVWSHAEGFEVSINGMHKALGMAESAVRAGLESLVSERWAAQEVLGGNRFALHVSRHEPFTPTAHARLHTKPSGRQNRRSSKVVRNSDQGVVRNSDQGVVRKPDYKEDQVRRLNKESRSAEPSSAKPLPDDWAPNAQHRRTAAKYRIDVDALAADFRESAIESHSGRTDWDRVFGKILSEVIEGSLRVGDFFGVAEHISEDADAYYVGEIDPGVIGVVSGGR